MGYLSFLCVFFFFFHFLYIWSVSVPFFVSVNRDVFICEASAGVDRSGPLTGQVDRSLSELSSPDCREQSPSSRVCTVKMQPVVLAVECTSTVPQLRQCGSVVTRLFISAKRSAETTALHLERHVGTPFQVRTLID